MKTSESIKNLAIALNAFQGEMKSLILDKDVKVQTRERGSYTFSYATFKNVVNSCRELLASNGLAISQSIGENGAVTTMLLHVSGEFITDTFVYPQMKSMQLYGSAISYAKRYSYVAILGLVADDDDDGNLADGNQWEEPDRIANGDNYNMGDIHKKMDQHI